jgi:hypothetical protein
MMQATVVFKVYWGEPKENICKAVTDMHLTFLVMGCRGLSAIKRYAVATKHYSSIHSNECSVII